MSRLPGFDLGDGRDLVGSAREPRSPDGRRPRSVRSGSALRRPPADACRTIVPYGGFGLETHADAVRGGSLCWIDSGWFTGRARSRSPTASRRHRERTASATAGRVRTEPDESARPRISCRPGRSTGRVQAVCPLLAGAAVSDLWRRIWTRPYGSIDLRYHVQGMGRSDGGR